MAIACLCVMGGVHIGDSQAALEIVSSQPIYEILDRLERSLMHRQIPGQYMD